MTQKKNKKTKTEEIENPVDLTQTISTLESGLKESHEKYLRLSAEFENYKKRVSKEKEELVNNTKVKMLQSILDMDNDLSYALRSSGDSGTGLKLIINKLDNFLKSQGIESIQTEIYDEDLHEVLSVIPSEKPGIVDVVSKGYTLNGKPFRYPKVILSKSED